MRRLTLRWIVLTASLLGAGTLGGMLFGRMVHAGDGGPSATALVSTSPGMGLAVLMLVFLLAAVMGVVGAKVCGPRTGLAAAGLTLLGPAWMSGTMTDLLRWAPAPGAFWRLAAEGAICIALATVVVRVIDRSGESDRRDGADPPLSAQSVLGACVCLAVGAAAAWVLARETTKGQTIAAGFFAGFIGATVARVVAHRSSVLALAAGAAALAVIGPVLGATLSGPEALRHLYEQRLIPLARPMPLDWIGGALLGLPLGMTWAASMVEKRMEAAPGALPAGGGRV